MAQLLSLGYSQSEIIKAISDYAEKQKSLQKPKDKNLDDPENQNQRANYPPDMPSPPTLDFVRYNRMEVCKGRTPVSVIMPWLLFQNNNEVSQMRMDDNNFAGVFGTTQNKTDSNQFEDDYLTDDEYIAEFTEMCERTYHQKHPESLASSGDRSKHSQQYSGSMK